MEHTKGPWRAGHSAIVADHPVPGISGSDDVAYYGGHLVAESVAPQNRALIAAAPELLATLDALLRFVSASDEAKGWNSITTPDCVVSAAAAIAKATAP